MSARFDAALNAALNRLCKWRMVLAGWQVGTREKEDVECAAIRDHREVTLLLRAEVSALVRVLCAKDIISEHEFNTQLLEEASMLSKGFEARFPGFKASDEGILVDVKVAAVTTKNWRK